MIAVESKWARFKVFFEYYKELVGNAVIIMWSGWLLFNWIVINHWGSITLYEDNLFIRYNEIGIFVLCIIIGIDRMVDDIKRNHWRD